MVDNNYTTSHSTDMSGDLNSPRFRRGEEVVLCDTDQMIPGIYTIEDIFGPSSGPHTYQLSGLDANDIWQEDQLRSPVEEDRVSCAPNPIQVVNSQGAGLAQVNQARSVIDRCSVGDLLRMPFTEQEWIVLDLIPTGLTAFGGRPKVGKSRFALQLSIAKATGGYFLGKKLTRVRCLYLALEDSPRRIQSRLKIMGVTDPSIPLEFAFNWDLLNNGGLEKLREEIEKNDYGLVVIDTISRVLGKMDQMELGLMGDIIGKLQQLATHTSCSILFIDHHRKPSGFIKDPIDDLLGSTGKSAPVDTALGLYKDSGRNKFLLLVNGRDVEEGEYQLSYDGTTNSYLLLGDNNSVRDDTLKGKILKAMNDMNRLGSIATTTKLAEHLGVPSEQISRALKDLMSLGKVRKGEKNGREQPYELITGEN